MNQRRASTLVELLICMTLGSSLMLVAIGMVHQTLSVSSRAKQQGDHARSLARLASLFRQDAHRAVKVSSGAEEELRMTGRNGAEVLYRFADQQIIRRRQVASGEVENESFALTGQDSAGFQALSDPDRAEVLIRRDTGLHNVQPRVELHVMAATGKLHWAEQGGGESQP